MPDVISVALITGAVALIPQLLIFWQNGRRGSRERTEVSEEAVRQACTDLLRSARDLRVQVTNTAAYHGSELGERLGRVRQLEADAATNADKVALRVPVSVADSAARLASAASMLATATEANIRAELGVSIRKPDCGELNDCIADFSNRVVRFMRGKEG